jgi:hypothetical protein
MKRATTLASAAMIGVSLLSGGAPAKRGRQHECGERDQSASSRCTLPVSHDVILRFYPGESLTKGV